MSWDVDAFREKLESQHTFPGTYTFKFIVPTDKKEVLLQMMPKGDVRYRESSNKKYTSVTASSHLPNSQAVLDVYFKVNKIEGSIAL